MDSPYTRRVPSSLLLAVWLVVSTVAIVTTVTSITTTGAAAAVVHPSTGFGIIEPGSRKSRRAHTASKELSNLVTGKFDELVAAVPQGGGGKGRGVVSSPPSTTSATKEEKTAKRHKQGEGDDGSSGNENAHEKTISSPTTTSAKLPSHRSKKSFVDEAVKKSKRGKKEQQGGVRTPKSKIAGGGVCPANGNLRTLYTTTQRGNNIASFDSFGRYLGLVIDPKTFPKFFEWQGADNHYNQEEDWEVDTDEHTNYTAAVGEHQQQPSSSVPDVNEERGGEVSESDDDDDEGIYGVQKLRQIKYGPDGLLYATSGRSTLSRIFALSPDGILAHDDPHRHTRVASKLTPYLREEADALVQKVLMEDRDRDVFSRLPPRLLMNKDCTRNYVYTLSRLAQDEGSSSTQVFAASHSKKKNKNGASSNTNNNFDLVVPSSDNVRNRGSSSSPPRLATPSSATPSPLLTPHQQLPSLVRRKHYYNPNMQHPYDFIFHPDDGTMYVTNQNTLSVTWYVGPTTTTKQLDDILTRSIAAAERALIPAAHGESSSNGVELRTNLKRLMLQLMDNPVAPVGEGDARDPIPLAGGRSGYAGMPIPPSYAVMRTLLTYRDLMSNDGMRFNNETRLEEDTTLTERNAHRTAKDAGSSSSSSSLLLLIDPSPSRLIPKEAVGVFASANTHVGAATGGAPFMSVRGIAISPLLPFSTSDGVFLHELSPSERELLINERSIKYSTNKTTTKKGEGGTRKGVKREDGGVEMIRVVVVADVVGSTIHVLHESTGEMLWQYVNVIKEPVQIHFPKRAIHMTSSDSPTHANDYWFYVTSKTGGVYRVPLRREAASAASSSKSVFSTIQPLIDSHGRLASSSRISGNTNNQQQLVDGNGGASSTAKTASGFFEDPDHNIAFLADRKGMRIRTYSTPDQLYDVNKGNKEDEDASVSSSSSGHSISTSSKQYLKQVEGAASLGFTGEFVSHLPDFPEFLLYTRVDSHTQMSMCHELTRSGDIKISSLCVAAQLWILLGVLVVVWCLLTRTHMGVIILAGCCGRTLTSQRVVPTHEFGVAHEASNSSEEMMKAEKKRIVPPSTGGGGYGTL